MTTRVQRRTLLLFLHALNALMCCHASQHIWQMLSSCLSLPRLQQTPKPMSLSHNAVLRCSSLLRLWSCIDHVHAREPVVDGLTLLTSPEGVYCVNVEELEHKYSVNL